MTRRRVSSWGRVAWHEHEWLEPRRGEPLPPSAAGATLLPYGNGRSYGDSALNPGGALLAARALDRIVDFDASSGRLRCEAGVLLSEILAFAVPRGWFLAVTPGTQFVSVGGAIANDVHGKNHHRAGSFGEHVLGFTLLRSDGERLDCSPTRNAERFAATVGGLGLTGLVTEATLQLRRIDGPAMQTETIRFRSLDEFFAISAGSESTHEYTAAWIDCAFGGARLGRGLFERGNHATGAIAEPPGRTLRVPVTPPVSLVGPWTLKAFNLAYFHRQRHDRVGARRHWRPFLYPLDAVLEWNRVYGPRGFYQYQCVVPPAAARDAVRALLEAIAASGFGSFLAVLKQFGDRPAPGMLSFPRSGTTLALDFPNRGEPLQRLFERLDRLVLDAGGRLYPAKDGRMDAAMFRAGYPQWQRFAAHVDPRFSSAFWRRVAA